MPLARTARSLRALTSLVLCLQLWVIDAATARADTAGEQATTASVTEPCGGSDPYPDDGPARTCTFSDEFDGTVLDRTRWSAVTTATSNFRGNERECFIDSPETISVSDGTLHLTSRTGPDRECAIPHAAAQTTQTISGSVSSIHSFAQRYGVYSIRAKFPAVTAAGLHSALWMWPVDPLKYGRWPVSGELDIAEFFSAHPDRAIPYLHYLYDPATTTGTVTGSAEEGYSFSGTNVATNNWCLIDPREFQTYTMIWTPTAITIKIDDQTCIHNEFRAYRLPEGAPFDQPFFMILTQALGAAGTANAPTSATPTTATTLVDYVRVWQ